MIRARGASALAAGLLATAAIAAAAILPAAAIAPAPAGRALPLERGISDPVFAALIAYVHADSHGVVTGDDFSRTIESSGRKSRLPYQRIERIARTPGPRPMTEEIDCVFTRDIKERIPYSILGYHPGSLRASQRSVWREWELGNMSIPHVTPEGRMAPVSLEDVHLWGIMQGEFWMDVDALVDRMLGGKIDDTRLTGFLIFRLDGRLYGMAFGYNKKHQGQSGVLTFDDDKVAFPSPDRMMTVARTMRAQAEAMLRAEERDRARAVR